MKTYAVKSNAARAAVSQGFTRSDIAQNEQGDWYVAAPAAPEAIEDIVPAAVADEDDDFAPPAFLQDDAKDAADLPALDLSPPVGIMVSDEEPVAAAPAEAPVATKTPSLRVSSVGFLAWLEEFLGKDTFAQISHPVVDAFKSAVEAVKPKAVSRRSRAPRTATPRTPGSTKLDQVAALLQRPEGCTRQDILDLTGWPSVTVPGMAAKAGLNLRQEKQGRSFRYWGTPIA